MFEEKYEVRDQGKVFAPMAKSVIRTLVTSGRLSEQAEVYDPPYGTWREMGIFLSLPKPPPPAPAARPAPTPNKVAPEATKRELVKVQRSRGLYVGLGLLLGMTGAHNFYAGYIGAGVGQFALGCFGWVLVLASRQSMPAGVFLLLVVWVWVLADLFRTEDSDGDPLG